MSRGGGFIGKSSRVALVTGAAGGIGMACARQLASQGYTLALTDTSVDIHHIAAQLADDGQAATGWTADLSDPAQAVGLVRQVLEKYGVVDVLVNVAGALVYKDEGGCHSIDELSLGQWNQVIALNLTAPFLLSREVLVGMRSQGRGRIINIISRTGRTYVPGVSADYVATKSGLQGFTRTLAGENARWGITANCVAPGRIDTPMTAGRDDVVARTSSSIPAGRAGRPEEVASAVTFLASDEAAYINGAVIDINGGGFMP